MTKARELIQEKKLSEAIVEQEKAIKLLDLDKDKDNQNPDNSSSQSNQQSSASQKQSKKEGKPPILSSEVIKDEREKFGKKIWGLPPKPNEKRVIIPNEKFLRKYEQQTADYFKYLAKFQDKH